MTSKMLCKCKTYTPHLILTLLFSQILEEHKKTCAKEGRYVGKRCSLRSLIRCYIEAEMAKNRIIELKLKQQTNTMNELLLNQEKER